MAISELSALIRINMPSRIRAARQVRPRDIHRRQTRRPDASSGSGERAQPCAASNLARSHRALSATASAAAGKVPAAAR